MYSNRNLLTSKAIATGTGVAGTTSETFTYDALGRVISGTDSNSNKLEFAYDSQGRLLSETNSGTTVGYAYDVNNNLAKIIYPDLREQTYAYDVLNRNTSIIFSGGTVATYAYTGILNTSIAYGNGKIITQTFDNLLRLKTLNNGVNSYSYDYDNAGNMLTDGQKNYGYDSIYRLTQSSDSLSGTTLESFNYDKAGNRISDTNNQYVSNTLNQYSTLSGTTNATYAYDHNGNVTDNGKYVFAYDYKNRLMKVSTGSTLIEELKYDILGRRIEKKTETETTKYVYADKNILTEARTENNTTFHKTYVNGLGTDNLIAYDNEEVNLNPNDRAELGFCASNVLSSTGSFVKYGYQNIVDRCTNLSNSGSVIVINRYFFHKNHLGSITGLTDNDGTTVAEYQYDAFGNAYQRTGSGTFEKMDSTTPMLYGNNRLYTGREYDSEISLHYLRARYYDANIGRFVSRDPIGQNDQINLYRYVGNNPIGFVDLSGKSSKAVL